MSTFARAKVNALNLTKTKAKPMERLGNKKRVGEIVSPTLLYA